MADLATAEVSLEVDFANLEPDVRAGLEERVKRAARSAQKELDETTLAAAALGDTINKQVGGQATNAAAKIRKAARASSAELARTGKAASSAGKQIADSANAAAAAVERVADAARDAGDTLFDIDDSGVVRLNAAVEAVQASLFDLDTVELERGHERALTFAQTLRRDVAGAAGDVRIGLRLAVDGFVDRIGELGARGSAGIGRVLDRLAEIEPATRRPARGIGRISAGLVSLAALGVAVAPAALVAGAGVAGFAALAVPAIVRVIKAQTEMAERWGSLTRAEKIAALQTSALVDRYKALAAELAPDALQVYNGALGNLAGLLPRLQPLFAGVLDALRGANQEIGAGFDSTRAQNFFRFLGAEAGPAVDLLVGLFIDLTAAVASVVQALAPLAVAGVGVLSFFVRLLTAVGDLSPELLQFVTILIAVRGPLSALGGFFIDAGNKAKTFAKATQGATLASRGLALAQAGLPGLVLAGAAALVFFAVKTSTAKTAADKLADSINATNKAAGNNLEGYREANKIFTAQLAPSYDRLNGALQTYRREQSGASLEALKGAQLAQGLSDANRAAFGAQERNNTAIANIKTGAAALGAQYAITTAQAIQLADVVGINLSKSISTNGVVTASVIDKINAYQAAVTLARNPTLALSTTLATAANESLKLEDRVNALTAALNLAANPTLALFGAQNRLKEIQSQTNKVIKDGLATQLDRQVALERSLGGIKALAEAEFASKQSVDEASASLDRQLPKLTRLAGNSQTGRAAIRTLRDALDEMRRQAAIAGNQVSDTGKKINNLPKSKNITITANTAPAQSAFQSLLSRIGLARPSIPIGIRAPGTAGATGGYLDRGVIRRRAGGPLRRAGGGGLLRGPGTGTSDSIPAVIDGGRGGFAALSNREYVINAKQTKRHFALIQAINRGQFKAGGLVGRARALAAGGPVRGYATGGQVGRASTKSLVNIGALVGNSIARGLRGSAPAIRKEVARISKSLEKKIVAIGQTVGTGFFARITGSPTEINAAFVQLQKQITRTFTGIRTRVDDLLVKRLERLNDRLATLANNRDALTKRIEAATQLAATVTERTRSFASVTGFDDTESTSADAITKTLRDRLTKIRRFQRDVATLTRRGLDKGVIQELVEGGPEQSGALARTLADAGASALREINALQKQIDSTSSRFGRDTADTLFDAGVAAGKGFLTGLKAQRKEVVALMTDIAKSVAKTVKTTLKIKSPSVVLRRLAVDTMRGYINGVRDLAARVRATVAAAVRPDTSVRRAAVVEPAAGRRAAPAPPAAPGSAGAGRTVEVTQNNHFHQVIADPRQIIAVTENRLVSALRGA